ncbi:hypothetical protein [Kytococcus sp. Marseille-QA3725]
MSWPDHSPAAPSPLLATALAELGRGRLHRPGAFAEPTRRWLGRQRTARTVAVVLVLLGLAAVVLGVALHQHGAWGLAALAGVPLVLVGTAGVGLTTLVLRGWRSRVRSEHLPVLLDARGVMLRGIGPIPWSELQPPERRQVPVKHDIGGRCTVLPLTPQGVLRLAAQPWRVQLRAGPRPYARLRVECVLLPGFEGLSEDEVLHLFSVAHRQFATR